MFKKQFGKMIVTGGIRQKSRGKNPICQICSKPVLDGDHGVLIKALGEYKREHHYMCLMEVFEFLATQMPIRG